MEQTGYNGRQEAYRGGSRAVGGRGVTVLRQGNYRGDQPFLYPSGVVKHFKYPTTPSKGKSTF